jgi:hypothetical protein
MEEEIYLVDNYTTNSILRETKYFQTLSKRIENIMTIVGCGASIVGNRKTNITFFMGIQVTIKNVFLYLDSTCTVLSYRDIHKNMLYIITHEENNK